MRCGIMRLVNLTANKLSKSSMRCGISTFWLFRVDSFSKSSMRCGILQPHHKNHHLYF